jgi:hypothetical protein
MESSMKSLEFERVSISDMRAEHDAQQRNRDETRRAEQGAAQISSVLSDATSLWIAGLPADVRPLHLARRFPRIVNSIADLWRRVARCEEYLETLVVDLRGDRSGFPVEVAKELTALRNYYADLHPQSGSSWDLVARDE